MKRGEIWRLDLDHASDTSKRPPLIVSPEAFNRLTQVPVVLPITSGRVGSLAPPDCRFAQWGGTRTTGVVCCDQERALDLRARQGKKLETIPITLWMKFWPTVAIFG